jgi:hypothetical protein
MLGQPGSRASPRDKKQKIEKFIVETWEEKKNAS